MTAPKSCRCAAYECSYCRRKRWAKEEARRDRLRQLRRDQAAAARERVAAGDVVEPAPLPAATVADLRKAPRP